MIHPAGAAIPVAGVAEVAFNLVQHDMNPRGDSVVFMLLDDLMRGVPLASNGQFNCLQQFSFRHGHAGGFTGERSRGQMDLRLHQNGRFRKLAAA